MNRTEYKAKRIAQKYLSESVLKMLLHEENGEDKEEIEKLLLEYADKINKIIM